MRCIAKSRALIIQFAIAAHWDRAPYPHRSWVLRTAGLTTPGIRCVERLDPYTGDAGADHLKSTRGLKGEVEHALALKRAAVIHAHDHGAVVGEVGDF